MAAFCGVRSGGSDGYPVAQDPGFLAGDLVFYRSFAGRSVSGRDGSLRGAGGNGGFGTSSYLLPVPGSGSIFTLLSCVEAAHDRRR